MPPIDIKCPECGAINMIDDAQLGQTIACPKCKSKFTAEAGDEYDIVGGPEPDASPEPSPAPPRPHAAPERPSRKLDPDAQKKLIDRFEKWAEE